MIKFEDFQLTNRQIDFIKRENARKKISKYIKENGKEPEDVSSFYIASEEDKERYRRVWYAHYLSIGTIPPASGETESSGTTENPDIPDNPDSGSTGEGGGEDAAGNNPEPIIPEITDTGIKYVWDESVIPQITMSISEEEWNRLLNDYDGGRYNSEYYHADITYTKGDESTALSNIGVRVSGINRPEGNCGEMHNSENPDWHHCHFKLDFQQYNADDKNSIRGIRKIDLKSLRDDPSYVREIFCYDLFRRYGIWTGAHDIYCRLWIHVEGDEKPAYYGVYQMIEPIDDKFVERRLPGMFESAGGYLWKCCNNGNKADLDGIDGDWAVDTDNGQNYTYEYKGSIDTYKSAKAQFQDFILKLTGKSEESFYKWIRAVCDVELLLKTYAVNVAVGMWDDHWANGNNFYVYFNSTDLYKYKFFFIPYNYMNSLGNSSVIDAGRQNPYEWGNTGLLMKRMMKFPEFRKIYKGYLLDIIDVVNDYFNVESSISRINAWQEKIREYVSNDTEEDNEISDKTAEWSNHTEYRLLQRNLNNFFTVKSNTIQAMGE